MAYHKQTKKFTQKTNRMDVKTLGKDGTENPDHCPVYVVYDIVYFNGRNLMNEPLHKRIDILQKKQLVVQPKDDIVIFSKQRVMESKVQVSEGLNQAIDDLEEGIVVKERNSIYKVGGKNSAWLKLKPGVRFNLDIFFIFNWLKFK